MAILKPSPSSPRRLSAGTRQPRNADARQRMGRDDLDPLGDLEPGASAKTTKAETPRAPGASPVRAKTV